MLTEYPTGGGGGGYLNMFEGTGMCHYLEVLFCEKCGIIDISL